MAPGPFLGLALCHCVTLPPCVQCQNHKHATERQPSASAVSVSDGSTPARWQKSPRKSATSRHWRLSGRPPEFHLQSQRGPLNSTPSPRPWGTGAFSGNHLIIRFLYHAFLAASSRGLEKCHLTFVPYECHKSVLRLKDILVKTGC